MVEKLKKIEYCVTQSLNGKIQGKKKRYKYQYTITYFVQLKGFENTKAIKIDE